MGYRVFIRQHTRLALLQLVVEINEGIFCIPLENILRNVRQSIFNLHSQNSSSEKQRLEDSERCQGQNELERNWKWSQRQARDNVVTGGRETKDRKTSNVKWTLWLVHLKCLFLTKPAYIGNIYMKHVCLQWYLGSKLKQTCWINIFSSQKRFCIRDKHKVTPVYENHHYIAFKCPPVQLNEE